MNYRNHQHKQRTTIRRGVCCIRTSSYCSSIALSLLVCSASTACMNSRASSCIAWRQHPLNVPHILKHLHRQSLLTLVSGAPLEVMCI